MIGYKLTTVQRESLIGKQFATDEYFNPVADINGDFFIFESEVQRCVNPDFSWVKEIKTSEYTPPKIEE